MTAAAFAAAPAAAGISPTAAPPAAAERPVIFDCQGERLLGILHPAAGDTGVVVIVGGPQYRAGSHRLFVQLSRALAAAGHPVLRFDVRGMGDSTGAQRSFEDISDDIGAAIAQLQQQQPQVRRVVLWGLCDGASAALLYLHERPDAPVQGLCLLNPWVRSEASHAKTRIKHYYRQRLVQREFWAKLLRGQVTAGAWRELMGYVWLFMRTKASATPIEVPVRFQERMLAGWRAFHGPTLLALSDNDYTAREFEAYCETSPSWRNARLAPAVNSLTLLDADHTLSRSQAVLQMSHRLVEWMARSDAASTLAAVH